MSIQWKSPKSGTCCDCTPGVCDPCDACPTADTLDLTISGIAACCSFDNKRMTGLGAVNSAHTLTRQESGDYEIVLTGAVSLDSFEEPDCETLSSTAGPYDVTIVFSCDADTATLDIRLTASGTRLFFEEIATPSEGGMFVFEGEADCSGFTPYTFGGSATVE